MLGSDLCLDTLVTQPKFALRSPSISCPRQRGSGRDRYRRAGVAAGRSARQPGGAARRQRQSTVQDRAGGVFVPGRASGEDDDVRRSHPYCGRHRNRWYRHDGVLDAPHLRRLPAAAAPPRLPEPRRDLQHRHASASCPTGRGSAGQGAGGSAGSGSMSRRDSAPPTYASSAAQSPTAPRWSRRSRWRRKR